MPVHLSQCGRAAITTVAALGLYQFCFNNSAESFIAPSSGSRISASQGEAKSLPLLLVLASAQPAVAGTNANSYDGYVTCIAALTAALVAVVSFVQRSHKARDPLSIADMPTAQQRRQMIAPLASAFVLPASVCFANQEGSERKADAFAKQEEEEQKKGVQKKKNLEEKRKREKEIKDATAKIKKEEEKEKESKSSKAEVGKNDDRDNKEKKEKEEQDKKEAEEKKRKEEEEAKKQQSGGSIFDPIAQVVVGGLGVAAVLPKKKAEGNEGAAEEAKKEDSAPKTEQAAPEVEEAKKDEAK